MKTESKSADGTKQASTADTTTAADTAATDTEPFTLPDGGQYYLLRQVPSLLTGIPNRTAHTATAKAAARRVTLTERDAMVDMGALDPDAGLVSVVPAALMHQLLQVMLIRADQVCQEL